MKLPARVALLLLVSSVFLASGASATQVQAMSIDASVPLAPSAGGRTYLRPAPAMFEKREREMPLSNAVIRFR